jgi:hypothetical protein
MGELECIRKSIAGYFGADKLGRRSDRLRLEAADRERRPAAFHCSQRSPRVVGILFMDPFEGGSWSGDRESLTVVRSEMEITPSPWAIRRPEGRRGLTYGKRNCGCFFASGFRPGWRRMCKAGSSSEASNSRFVAMKIEILFLASKHMIRLRRHFRPVQILYVNLVRRPG